MPKTNPNIMLWVEKQSQIRNPLGIFFSRNCLFSINQIHFKSLYKHSLRSLSGSSYPCSGLSSGRCKPVFSGRPRKSRLMPPKGLPAARNLRDTPSSIHRTSRVLDTVNVSLLSYDGNPEQGCIDPCLSNPAKPLLEL